ncbi:MAG TPA: hypothetical protein PLG09_10170 [Syntrophomonadaceae bacterium]|nr:hypothetical protein [Syntrophomonadaceae bacterium]HPU49627.1 hypothetical protein [Syntrophomonadaceae bacterium]
MIIIGGAAVLVSLVLYLKLGSVRIAVLMAMMMVMGLACFLPIVSSFRLGQEWNNHTIYLMMSLPVGGGMILGSRLAALLTQYVFGTLIVGICGLLLAGELAPELYDNLDLILPYLDIVVLFYLCTVAWIGYLISVSFFSQIIGKLVSRFSGLVTIVTFFATLWLSVKMMGLMLGQRTIEAPDVTAQIFWLLLGVITLVAAVIFALSTWVYNRRVEL